LSALQHFSQVSGEKVARFYLLHPTTNHHPPTSARRQPATYNRLSLMPVITAIERIKFKRRAELWLDGERAFSLGLDVIAISHLAAGKTVDEAEIAGLRREDERQQAVEGALRLLSLSPRSEKDLGLRLRRLGLGREAVEAAVARMKELGYLDDARFAQSYVQARQSVTPRSRRYLAFELGQKGVARDLSAPALEEVSDEDAAYAAAQRRLPSLRNADQASFQRRLASFLAGRGFGYGIVRAIIERCWRETRGEEE
jgi:regulatory protein